MLNMRVCHIYVSGLPRVIMTWVSVHLYSDFFVCTHRATARHIAQRARVARYIIHGLFRVPPPNSAAKQSHAAV